MRPTRPLFFAIAHLLEARLNYQAMQKTFVSGCLALFYTGIAAAQTAATNATQTIAESPDFFRSIGKIYTVFGVLFMIFVGIVGFLIHLERRLAGLEKEA